MKVCNQYKKKWMYAINTRMSGALTDETEKCPIPCKRRSKTVSEREEPKNLFFFQLTAVFADLKGFCIPYLASCFSASIFILSSSFSGTSSSLPSIHGNHSNTWDLWQATIFILVSMTSSMSTITEGSKG